MNSTLIHVNQGVAASNRKLGTEFPALTVKEMRTATVEHSNRYAHSAVLHNSWGDPCFAVKHDASRGLFWMEAFENCRLVILDETETPVPMPELLWEECWDMAGLPHRHVHITVSKDRIRNGEGWVYTLNTSHAQAMAHSVRIYSGHEHLGDLVYRPDRALSCGAKAWLAAGCQVEAFLADGAPAPLASEVLCELETARKR